ncbi:NAD-dependent epimerase/dehydratase family protein [Microbacterium panaciterrae]|uniref:NAD-dependent epimerase/dehydratase domain-containing protein n=1 Tax=Microbacterium panaciterrae TaxID=985759 RepID=A0ABP8PCP0_9MICO
MTDLHWVVGSGGLLGSAVVRSLRSAGEAVFAGPQVRWATDNAAADLRDGLHRLVEAAGVGGWRVYWCAGVGVTGSRAESLRTEVDRFEALTGAIAGLPRDVQTRGAIFVASSAGAAYAGSHGAPFDELSVPVPLGEYGHAKLAIEAAAGLLTVESSTRCIVGRIANLYGLGQSLAKPQGLISHLCRSYVSRAPLSVYVPLDTLRDYIFVDDCADLIVKAVRRVGSDESPRHVTKILASGRSVSIGALLGEFRRVVGRRPEIIMGSSPVSSLQSRDLRLRSVVLADLDRQPMTNLADGIARTLEEVRALTLAPSRRIRAD